jgi:hypothetical protein
LSLQRRTAQNPVGKVVVAPLKGDDYAWLCQNFGLALETLIIVAIIVGLGELALRGR